MLAFTSEHCCLSNWLFLQGTLVEWILNVGVYVRTLLVFRVAEGLGIPDDVSEAFSVLTL